MIPGMYFVYSLSCDFNVFYIGMTGDLATRYKSHLQSHKYKQASPAAKHIGNLLAEKKQIKLTIIAHLPREAAEKKEKEAIYLFSSAGHKIYNEQHTLFRYWDRKWPQDVTTKQIIKHLKYLQYSQEDTYCCLNGLDYEQTTSDKRPHTSSGFC